MPVIATGTHRIGSMPSKGVEVGVGIGTDLEYLVSPFPALAIVRRLGMVST